ncbi:MAG: NAD(P)-dependent alcohol dehydrogenase [Candidatus Thorarchaeota archaeon]|nr:NAD(P)-dependent alcohol dehydrogenase [Candidatus Thorarchaeota archaeon]
MRAVVFEKYGPPEVLQIKEIEKPTPKENEVLVKMHATSVTAADWRMRKTDPFLARMMNGLFRPKKFNILGIEIAGEVEEVGGGVTLFKPGDQIFGTIGFTFGAYAEYVCIPEDGSITHKPMNLSFGESAVVPVGADTALFFLRTQGNLQSGQKILIYGASSSVGSYAVQLARYYGADITAVCSIRNLEWVKNLGANKMIDYTKEDFTKGGETYDAIFDAVGKLSLFGSMKALKEGGVFLDAVHMMRRSVQAKFATMRSSKRILGGTATGLVEDLAFIKELIEAGELKPVIDRTYPIEEIAEAHRYVETGRKKGNVVVTFDHP